MTVVRYEPRGAARDLFSCREPRVLLDGPAGTGKSLAALFRVHLAALRYPGSRHLIVRKTAVSLSSTTLVTFDEKVTAEAQSCGMVRWHGGSKREAAAYRYSNGSRIVVGGMDKPEKIMSSEYDLAFADEGTELTLTDADHIVTRLRRGTMPWQQLLLACNPVHPTHWLNQLADDGAIRRLLSRHTDNPMLYGPDGQLTARGRAYMANLEALTGVRRLRLLKGLWVSAEGIIYEGWDPAIHMVDRFDIPDEWPRYWAVDFGHTNPFVCQWWAEDPDGRLIRYREIYMSKRTVDQHAETIARQVMKDPVKAGPREPWEGEWTEPAPVAVICDHDAEGRAVLQRELGIRTTPAVKKVSEGIQAMEARLRPAGDGLPRMAFMRDSLVEVDQNRRKAFRPACTEEEIPGYIWLVKPGGKVAEEPRKEDDHGCDTSRYTAAHFDLKPKYNIRHFE